MRTQARFFPLLLLGALLHLLAHHGVGAATRTLFRIDGAASFYQLGGVAPGRDVNGDGTPDFLVSAPSANGDVGVVEIRSGVDNSLIQSTAGTAASQFGASPVWGHFNDDEILDFACGLPTASRAQVRFGPTYSSGVTLNGTASTLLGTAVANAGDLLGNDGLDDLLVGANGDDENGTEAGRVVIWSPATGQTVHLAGQAAGDQFGVSVASIGDLNGDTVPEFIVGAPYRNSGALDDSGAVYIYSGSTLSSLGTISGPASGDYLGLRVSELGDINGDNVPEFAASAPYASGTGDNDAGIILVYDGASVLSGSGVVAIRRLEGASVLQNHRTFGLSLAPAGDVNGDGIPDLLAGCPLNDPQGRVHAGSALVYSGLNGALLERVDGETAGQNLGADVASAGDVNGDGRPDLLLGSPNNSPQGKTNAGSVYVQLVPGPAPAITNVRVENVTLTSARVCWTTNLPADSRVDYGTDTGYGLSVTDSVLKLDHCLDLTGLAADTLYHYRLTASTRSSTGSTLSSDLEFRTLPTVPSNLQVNPHGDRALRLTWVDQSRTEMGFKVFRKAGSGPFQELLPSPCVPAGTLGSTLTYDDASLLPNTLYTYFVRASHAWGDSAASEMASERTLPASPGSVAISAVTETGLTLSWTDPNPTSPTSWEIERSVAGGPFQPVETVAGTVLNRSYPGLTANTHYQYRVRGLNESGPSASWTNSPSAPTLPAAPSNLSAEAQSASSIQLTWNAAVPGAPTGYRIHRRQGMGAYAQIAEVGPSPNSYLDSNGLQANTAYTYQVRAYNASGEAAPATSSPETTYPAAPGAVTATAAGPSSIQLTWAAPVPGTPAGYRIHRRRGMGAYLQINTVGASPTTYTDSALEANTLYTYQVRAYNSDGESEPGTSNEEPTHPLPPQNLVPRAVGPDSIELTWTDPNPTPASAYRLERQEGSGAFIPLAGSVQSPHTDSSLARSTVYRYRVVASNSKYASSPSEALPAVTGPILTVVSIAANQIVLNWGPANPAILTYRIERQSGAGLFQELTQVPGSVLNYSDNTLTPKTIYHYRFQPIVTGIPALASAYSNPEAGLTRPTAVQLTAETESSSAIRLNWSPANPGVQLYRVFREINGTFTQVAEVPGGTQTYVNTGLASNQEYRFRVRAVNGGGESLDSTIASAWTAPAAGGKLIVKPPRVNFGKVSRGSRRTKSVTLSNKDRFSTLECRVVEVIGEGFRLVSGSGPHRLAPRSRPPVSVTIEFAPGDRIQRWSGSLRIRSGSPGQEDILIPLTAISR